MGTHPGTSCLPYHSHSDLAESSVIVHRFGDNTIYTTPAISQCFPNVSNYQFCMPKNAIIYLN